MLADTIYEESEDVHILHAFQWESIGFDKALEVSHFLHHMWHETQLLRIHEVFHEVP
jgi:hypothetical protein